MTREEAIETLEHDMRMYKSYFNWDRKNEFNSRDYNKAIGIMARVAYARAEKLRDELVGDNGRDVLR